MAGQRRVDRRVTLTPEAVWRHDLRDVPAGEAVTVELSDAAGATVLRHTEGTFDRTPASQVRLGPTGEPSASQERELSASAILARGTADELNGRRLAALDAYRSGLARDPTDASLLEAAGRLALALGWVEAGNDAAITWLQTASTAHPTDAELGYYLGVALAAAGRGRRGAPAPRGRAALPWDTCAGDAPVVAACRTGRRLVPGAGVDVRPSQPRRRMP